MSRGVGERERKGRPAPVIYHTSCVTGIFFFLSPAGDEKRSLLPYGGSLGVFKPTPLNLVRGIFSGMPITVLIASTKCYMW